VNIKKISGSRLVKKALPIGSRRRDYVSGLSKKSGPNSRNELITYKEWQRKCEPLLFKDSESKKNTYNPLMSIVVPCYNTPEKYIKPLIESVIQQRYPNWELVLVNPLADKEAAKRIENLSKQDSRIVCIPIDENLGIVDNTNVGLKYATGDFVAFLDHDDTLSPYALLEVVNELNKDHRLDLIYSDEDKLSDDGKTRLPYFFKPEWSPELLLGVNYIAHFVVARKSIIDKIGGLRRGFDGAQDYDFLLRFSEKTNNIKRISKILYHWRMAEGSTSADMSHKNYADTAGQRALHDAAKRRGIVAKVLPVEDHPTNNRLQYSLPKEQPKVSITIPFKNKVEILRQCVGSILSKTTYINYELILISNNSTEPELFEYLDTLKNESKCKVFYWDHPFNYSTINNYGRKQAKGEYLILLNNDTEVITPNWIEELVGVAAQPDIGAVGPLLLYPNKTIQHAGIILGLGSMAGHVFRNHLISDWTYFGLASWPRNYLAVTGACLVIAAKKYDQAGGLDETFTIAGQDVALGISLHKMGYRNVYWPFAELIHYENVSVGSYNNAPKLDYDHSLKYYKPYTHWKDPYFNPNLDLMNEQVALRSEYE
jgi:glycosyltransferase involved in cell wall biosynthesis